MSLGRVGNEEQRLTHLPFVVYYLGNERQEGVDAEPGWIGCGYSSRNCCEADSAGADGVYLPCYAISIRSAVLTRRFDSDSTS